MSSKYSCQANVIRKAKRRTINCRTSDMIPRFPAIQNVSRYTFISTNFTTNFSQKKNYLGLFSTVRILYGIFTVHKVITLTRRVLCKRRLPYVQNTWFVYKYACSIKEWIRAPFSKTIQFRCFLFKVLFIDVSMLWGLKIYLNSSKNERLSFVVLSFRKIGCFFDIKKIQTYFGRTFYVERGLNWKSLSSN